MAKKALKDKAWKLFSLYIKMRDSDSEGYCSCCTCEKIIPFDSKECHAGHFVAGRTNAVLFDDKITHAQCQVCNMWGSGEQGKYVLFMKKHYGYNDDYIDELLRKKHDAVKMSDDAVIELIASFYAMINLMLNIKFGNRDDMVSRVRTKISSWGMKKMLELDKTLGTIHDGYR